MENKVLKRVFILNTQVVVAQQSRHILLTFLCIHHSPRETITIQIASDALRNDQIWLTKGLRSRTKHVVISSQQNVQED